MTLNVTIAWSDGHTASCRTRREMGAHLNKIEPGRFNLRDFAHSWKDKDGSEIIAQPVMDKMDKGRLVAVVLYFTDNGLIEDEAA